jgi:hypothetical protein
MEGGKRKRPRIELGARQALKIGMIAIAAALLVFRLPAGAVERYYSLAVYPRLQWLLTPVSNLAPFALVDALLIVVATGIPICWIVSLARSRRGERLKRAGQLGVSTLVVAAVGFIAFDLLWGLNYERESLTDKLDYEEARVTVGATTALARTVVHQLNAESQTVHKGPWPSESEWRANLHSSFDRVVTELGASGGIVAALPKKSLINGYLTAAGIDGFMNPFGDEVILVADLLPVEKPFALSHEWGHVAGYADEGEASFVGLLACLRSGSPAVRYSGWLALYQQLPRRTVELALEAKGASDGSALELAPEVAADLNAINERRRKNISAAVSDAQSRFYDGFLKANRVEAGIGSYGQLVALLVGTRFEGDWGPTKRAAD